MVLVMIDAGRDDVDTDDNDAVVEESVAENKEVLVAVVLAVVATVVSDDAVARDDRAAGNGAEPDAALEVVSCTAVGSDAKPSWPSAVLDVSVLREAVDCKGVAVDPSAVGTNEEEDGSNRCVVPLALEWDVSFFTFELVVLQKKSEKI